MSQKWQGTTTVKPGISEKRWAFWTDDLMVKQPLPGCWGKNQQTWNWDDSKNEESSKHFKSWRLDEHICKCYCWDRETLVSFDVSFVQMPIVLFHPQHTLFEDWNVSFVFFFAVKRWDDIRAFFCRAEGGAKKPAITIASNNSDQSRHASFTSANPPQRNFC